MYKVLVTVLTIDGVPVGIEVIEFRQELEADVAIDKINEVSSKTLKLTAIALY